MAAVAVESFAFALTDIQLLCFHFVRVVVAVVGKIVFVRRFVPVNL
jgi:hypothetical protein